MIHAMSARAHPSSGSLRADLAEETRRRILNAAIAQLADESAAELTIPDVARRAGVAVRTVYRYFPTKDELLQSAGSEFDKRVGFHEFADAIEKLEPQLRELYRRFSNEEPSVRAALDSRVGREVRSRVRPDRMLTLERTLEPLLEGLDIEERRRTVALVYLFFSAQTWRLLLDYAGMTTDQAAETASAGLTAVLDSLERAGTRRRRKR